MSGADRVGAGATGAGKSKGAKWLPLITAVFGGDLHNNIQTYVNTQEE